MLPKETKMSPSSSYTKTLAGTTCLAFPTPPVPSLGTPNLFVLNNLLQYMCKCAQTHKSSISKKMNLLYIAIDPTLYRHYYSSEAYPHNDYPFPNKNGTNVPNFSGFANTIEHALKVTHGMAFKKQNDIINMNSAFIDAFLNLVPLTFKQSHKRSEDTLKFKILL
jgi:hypothetical protein